MIVIAKKFAKLFSVLLCVLLVCISFAACSQEKTEVGKFNIDDYSYYIENFTKDINVGKIEDADDAVSKAEKIWIETYGGETMKDEKPYNVCFDEENNCWYVYGTFKQPLFGNKKGGVAEIIFDAEGNVLALWHGK